MRIKINRKGSGYVIRAFSNDRRAQAPLATAKYDDLPTMIPKSVFKSRIMDLMNEAGHEYARHHDAQRYTGISRGE